MNEGIPYSIFSKLKLKKTSLIVAWTDDTCNLGVRVADYLIDKLGCNEIGEIRPEGFFSMAGVNVVDDVAQFPESKFYLSSDSKVLVFKSGIPRTDWHRFLTVLLDIAQKECAVNMIYTVGAMVSISAHTTPRELVSIVNMAETKSEFESFDVKNNTDYENPSGQKPTLSSYLIWLARQRGISSATLWVPVPFYLVSADDPRSCKRVLSFFNAKFSFSMDFTSLDAEITEQNSKISSLYARDPDAEALVHKLEAGQALSNEENEKLVHEMADHLKGNQGS